MPSTVRDRIVDELEVVEVVELGRIMFGAFGIEQLEATRPRLHRVLPDQCRPSKLFDQPSVVCWASEHIDAMMVSTGRWHCTTSASG